MYDRKVGSSSAVLIMLLGFTAFSLIAISGCLDRGGDEKLDLVVVSIAPQKELLQRIVGEDIKVIVMVPQGMDPHSYSPTPSQLLEVTSADLYFKMGSGIEFEEQNMDTIRETNPSMKIVDISEGIEIISFEDHGIDHVHEEQELQDHDGTDPHIWLDPGNMLEMANTVLETLITEDPDNEDIFSENYRSYTADLTSRTEEVRQMLMPFKNRSFLTYHPSWDILQMLSTLHRWQ